MLAEDDTHVGSWVDLAAMLGLSVLTLKTVVSKWSEIEKSYLHCEQSFSREPKSLKTLQLEELGTTFWCGSSKCIPPTHLLMDPT